jgi:hypothetical protein
LDNRLLKIDKSANNSLVLINKIMIRNANFKIISLLYYYLFDAANMEVLKYIKFEINNEMNKKKKLAVASSLRKQNKIRE